MLVILTPCLESGNPSALSLFQQLVIVLMKLRLNVGDQDLAFRYGVSQSTLSRNFSKWIDVMYIRYQVARKRETFEDVADGFQEKFQKQC